MTTTKIVKVPAEGYTNLQELGISTVNSLFVKLNRTIRIGRTVPVNP
ncbi:MAG: hypothetical protein PHQ46_00455 [Negativicutes bacterium]|nr:hypothetical protein [Negativicutes bacterium]